MIAALPPHTFLPEPERLAEMGIRLLLTLVGALLLWQLSMIVIGRVERWLARSGRNEEQREQRARTLGQIFRNLVVVLVFGGAAIHALEVLGWNVGPLLAGAGILGVALGFGAQTLVRDIIAGFFILVENQFAVGDVIDVNGNAATVEAVTLRHTQLRDFNGYVLFVPNGEMKIVTNRSRGWNRVVVDVPVAVGGDLDGVLAACRRAAESLNADPGWRPRLLDPVQLWGVESLGANEATVRLVVRARPGGDAGEAARELRRRLLRSLAEAGAPGRTKADVSIQPGPPDGGGDAPPDGRGGGTAEPGRGPAAPATRTSGASEPGRTSRSQAWD